MLSKVTKDKAVILNADKQKKKKKNEIFKLLKDLNIFTKEIVEII